MPSMLSGNVSNFAAGIKPTQSLPKGGFLPPHPLQGGVVTLTCARQGSLQVRSTSVSSPFPTDALNPPA